MTLHDDNELPEDHATLLQLAAGVQMAATPVSAIDPVPGQRGIAISDQATELVGEPLIGLVTHGR
jgi:hypothetical protein